MCLLCLSPLRWGTSESVSTLSPGPSGGVPLRVCLHCLSPLRWGTSECVSTLSPRPSGGVLLRVSTPSPSVPQWIQFQVPTTVPGSLTHPLLAAFPSLSTFLPLAFLHSDPPLKPYFGRKPSQDHLRCPRTAEAPTPVSFSSPVVAVPIMKQVRVNPVDTYEHLAPVSQFIKRRRGQKGKMTHGC